MSSSSTMLKEANKISDIRWKIAFAFGDPKILTILHYLNTHGATPVGDLVTQTKLDKNIIDDVLNFCSGAHLLDVVNDSVSLSQTARKRIAHAVVNLEFLEKKTVKGGKSKNSIPSTFHILKCIGKGATSFTFLAIQDDTGRKRTLKIYLPDTISYSQLDAAIKKRASIEDPCIPEIVNAGEVEVTFPDGHVEILLCVALKYINGQTFSQFVRDIKNISVVFLEKFIENIGSSLSIIEAAGLTHGDLHEGNILVESEAAPNIADKFWLIDFIGVPSVMSSEMHTTSDIDNFRDHLLRAAIIVCERSPGHSARRLLGDRVFRVLTGLREGKYSSFKDMLIDFRRQNRPIPEDHFKEPKKEPFEWLRVEWVPSARDLFLLFEPDYARYSTIAKFGNSWISGPRGSGKSHYLRILGFHPSAIQDADKDDILKVKMTQLNYDFKSSFGVIFACRLGEFKGFTPEAVSGSKFDLASRLFIKHIIVLKIWNKTLSTIQTGLEKIILSTGKSILELPLNLDAFKKFLEERIGSIALIDDKDTGSVFRQCSSICEDKEIAAIAAWPDPAKRDVKWLLNEKDLDAFFGVIKDTFPDLKDTKFIILVDDASYGHIDFETQKILNSLVRAAHANHCFKITHDKFMYTLDTADGRAIDPRHEANYVDLGEVSTKSQKDMPFDLPKYMARVVDARLKAANYSSDIKTILGKSQSSVEFLRCLSSSKYTRRSAGTQHRRSNAYYAGWNIVCSLSHGSVRTLLELIEHIFKANDVTPEVNSISLRAQDKAVRTYSKRQYKSLSMLPGEIDEEPLGNKLQAVIGSIGEMSKQYLTKYDTGEENRWYETISIERLDRNKLDESARFILNELLKYGLILNEGVTFSRADMGLSQRYDMNKIFSPALETTYRVRNHLYLSKKPFEEMLLKPDLFLRRHRKKIADLARFKEMPEQQSLFEDTNE